MWYSYAWNRWYSLGGFCSQRNNLWLMVAEVQHGVAGSMSQLVVVQHNVAELEELSARGYRKIGLEHQEDRCGSLHWRDARVSLTLEL